MKTPEMRDEVNAVKNSMQLYINGAEGNADLLVETFHADARMFGHIGETRRDVPITEFINGVRNADRKLTGAHPQSMLFRSTLNFATLSRNLILNMSSFD